MGTVPPPKPDFDVQAIGRNLGAISIHPNGEDWILSECPDQEGKPGGCFILKFNVRTGQLFRYATPGGYEYSMPAVSPNGTWIVAVRIPLHDNTPEQFQQALQSGEIVMMKADGTEFQVTAIPKGIMASPAMSPGETKIAYWRAETIRPPRSKTWVTDFDIHEYDIKNRSAALFAGPFHFYGVGELLYQNEDRITFGALYPREMQRDHEYEKKNNYSEIYGANRHDSQLPAMPFTNLEGSKFASRDQAGNYYMEAQEPRLGTGIYRVTPGGKTERWNVPKDILLNGTRDLVAVPSSQYMVVGYATREKARPKARGIATLDLTTGRWTPIELPALESATVLPLIKTYQQQD